MQEFKTGHNLIAKIHEWNDIVSNECRYRELQDEDVRMYYNLIREEFEELQDAYSDSDRTEVVDALADMIVVIVGMSHMMGYDMTELLDKVVISNYSKFVRPPHMQDKVNRTMDNYRNDSRYSDIEIIGGVVWGTVRKTGSKKVLKGADYFPPQFQHAYPELRRK